MNRFPWPDGRRAAVCLTYDDAMPCHYQTVGPQLDAAGLRATFYTPIRASLLDHADAWRALAERGHELGNHTIFHPCRREVDPAGAWLNESYNLATYTPDRLESELDTANRVLRLIDGRSERSYGNTCHHTTVGMGEHETPMDEVLGRHFVAARGGRRADPVDPATCNPMNLGTTGNDNWRLSEYVEAIDRAVAVGGLVTFCRHNVAEGFGRLQGDVGEHQRMVDHIAGRLDELWVAPLVEIGRHIRRVHSA